MFKQLYNSFEWIKQICQKLNSLHSFSVKLNGYLIEVFRLKAYTTLDEMFLQFIAEGFKKTEFKKTEFKKNIYLLFRWKGV